MDATARTPVVTFASVLLVWFGLAASSPNTHAQLADTTDNTQPSEPSIALDIEALLGDDRVLTETVDSNIWTVTAQPGRRLIQVPFIVTPTDETTRLAAPSIKLRGGRFVAWRIVADEQDRNAFGGGGQTSFRDSPVSIGSLRNTGIEDLEQLDNPGGANDQDQAADSLELGDALPDNIPVLARDMMVSPDGVIHWELERAIAGAEVKSGQEGYFLKLRPDRLQELEPQRPERNTRQGGGRGAGQDSREAAARQRAADLEYRTEATAYRALRDQVRKLPDEFRATMPSRLWAIYEVSDRADEMSFTGGPPMPWQIKMDDLATLQQVASRSGGGTELTAEDFTAVSQMTLMLANEHPLTQRAVASTMASAQMFGRAQQGDALYRLIDKLLKCGDPETVRTAAGGLAATTPPTPATLSLLRGALAHMDPGAKLLALSGLLTSEDNDPIGQRQMIDTANQMMVDPEGPGVVYVLEQLAAALADKPDAVVFVGSGIRFDSLDEVALDQAIVYVANAAGDSTVAAEWMNHGLLGSSDPRVANRTIEVLATSAPGGGMISMLTQKLVVFTFGPPNKDAANRVKPKLRGIARVPINTTNHSIYRALNAGDPDMRAMGWKALRHFQVRDQESGFAGGQPQGQGGAADQPDRMQMILDAAFNETVTPTDLVVFLNNQEDEPQSTAALVRLVVEGRGPAITQAARALVRSGRFLEQPVQALSVDQRGAFAVRLYEAVTGSSPMIAGLMRVEDARSPLVNWFAQYVSSTGLPDTEDWVPAANGEENLLNLAASNDPALADGAVAGLVASAGGDDDLARDLARKMSNAPDRSVMSLREQWNDAKQDIFVSRLTHAAGRYRLVVNLRGSTDNGFGGSGGGFGFPGRGGSFDTAANAPLIKSYNVATIELEADGQSLGLASGTLTLGVPEEHLAISLLDPTELKDFGHDELAQVPIEDVEGAIDLLPQKDGSWRGASPLLDGRSIEVVFDPE